MLSSSPFPRRAPRATLDPVDSAARALSLLGDVVGRPWRTETIVIPLDNQHRGREILAVNGTDDLERVVELVVPALQRAGLHPTWLLAATVTPRRPPVASESWTDRWLAAAHAADRAECPLLEWFVLGPGGPWCPRDLLGVPPRWPAR